MDGGAGFSEIWETFLYLKGASSYATAASMALVVWEYLVTFSQEVELVWPSRWSLPKVVYLLNRYITLLMALSYLLTTFFGARTPMRCTLLGFLTGNYAWIAIVFVQLILQIWLYAIYNRRYYCRLLIPLSIICISLAFLVFGFSMRFGFTVRLMSHDPICLDVSSSDAAHGWHPTSNDLNVLIHAKFPMFITGITVAWDMMTVIFLCLIAGKVAYTYLQRHQRYDGLAYILVRDSIVYSIAIIVVTFVNAILILSAPYALYTVGCGFTASVPNVLANRIWINLREWEKFRKDRMEVDGITDFDKWETLFRITV